MNAVISAVMKWLLGVINGVWEAFIRFLNDLITWVVDLLILVLNFGVDVIVKTLKFFVGLLPEAPDWQNMGMAPALLASADYFVPLGAIAAGLGLMGTTYVLSYVYKGGKFLRGGG